MDNWKTADRGRRLDHVWTSPALADSVRAIKVSKEARGWAQPSDHVPVTLTLEL
jgi:exodeoxyribonuclease-3